MFFGFGALGCNLTIKLLFNLNCTLGNCYVISGVFLFCVICINVIGLKSNYHLQMKKPNKVENTTQIYEALKPKIKEAWEAYKSNGWLMILLVIQILGSSDFHIFLSLLALYLKSLFPAGVDEQTQNILVNNTQTLVSVAMIFANFVYGYFLDKKSALIKVIAFELVG